MNASDVHSQRYEVLLAVGGVPIADIGCGHDGRRVTPMTAESRLRERVGLAVGLGEPTCGVGITDDRLGLGVPLNLLS